MMYSIRICIFNDLDKSLFISLFEIINPRLTRKWHLVDDDQADIVITDPDAPCTKNFRQTCKNGVNQIPVIYAKNNNSNSPWFIKKPLRAAELIDILNTLVKHLDDTNDSATAKLTAKHIAEKTSDDEDDSLISKIKSLSRRNFPTELVAENRALLLVDPKKRLFYLRNKSINLNNLPPELSTLFSSRPQDLSVSKISDMQLLRSIKENALCSFSLDILNWVASLMTSTERLHNSLNQDHSFQLKRWPNFALLPHTPIHVMLAAFMVKQSATVSTIMSGTKLPKDQVVSVINACQAINLITVAVKGKVLTMPKRRLNDQTNRFVGNIFSRLFRQL